jgi:hypothetical protein
MTGLWCRVSEPELRKSAGYLQSGVPALRKYVAIKTAAGAYMSQ